MRILGLSVVGGEHRWIGTDELEGSYYSIAFEREPLKKKLQKQANPKRITVLYGIRIVRYSESPENQVGSACWNL